jgi:hypothetical protein
MIQIKQNLSVLSVLQKEIIFTDVNDVKPNETHSFSKGRCEHCSHSAQEKAVRMQDCGGSSDVERGESLHNDYYQVANEPLETSVSKGSSEKSCCLNSKNGEVKRLGSIELLPWIRGLRVWGLNLRGQPLGAPEPRPLG